MDGVTAKKIRTIIGSIARNGIVPPGRVPKYSATLCSNDLQSSPERVRHDGISAFLVNPPFILNKRPVELTDSFVEGESHIIPMDFGSWKERSGFAEEFWLKAMRDMTIREFMVRLNAIKSNPESRHIESDLHAILWMVMEDVCYRRPLDNFMQIAFERPVIPIFPEKYEIEQRFRRSIICLCGNEQLKIYNLEEGSEMYIQEIPPKNIRAVLAPTEVFRIAHETFSGTKTSVVEVNGTRKELLRLYRFPFQPSYCEEDEFTFPDYLPVMYQMVIQDPSLTIGHLVRLPTDRDMVERFIGGKLLKYNPGGLYPQRPLCVA